MPAMYVCMYVGACCDAGSIRALLWLIYVSNEQENMDGEC